MSLTQQEMDEAQQILDEQGTGVFYDFLNNEGDPYGRLGSGVTNNDTWQGEIANGFAKSAAGNNSDVDMTPGSDDHSNLYETCLNEIFFPANDNYIQLKMV